MTTGISIACIRQNRNEGRNDAFAHFLRVFDTRALGILVEFGDDRSAVLSERCRKIVESLFRAKRGEWLDNLIHPSKIVPMVAAGVKNWLEEKIPPETGKVSIAVFMLDATDQKLYHTVVGDCRIGIFGRDGTKIIAPSQTGGGFDYLPGRGIGAAAGLNDCDKDKTVVAFSKTLLEHCGMQSQDELSCVFCGSPLETAAAAIRENASPKRKGKVCFLAFRQRVEKDASPSADLEAVARLVQEVGALKNHIGRLSNKIAGIEENVLAQQNGLNNTPVYQKVKCVRAYTRSQGKTPVHNSDFVVSAVLERTRAIAVLGDFAEDRTALARSCEVALNNFFASKKDEWIDGRASAASIVLETGIFVNKWLGRQTGDNRTTLVVALYDSKEKRIYYINRGDSGIVIVGKEGDSSVRFLAIGDEDDGRSAAGHLSGEPKHFLPRVDELKDGDAVFAFTDGLWENLKPLRPENKRFFFELMKGSLQQIEAKVKNNIFEKSSFNDDMAVFCLKEDLVEVSKKAGQSDISDLLAKTVDRIEKRIERIDYSDDVVRIAKSNDSMMRYVSEEFKDLRIVIFNLNRKIEGIPNLLQSVSAKWQAQSPPAPSAPTKDAPGKPLREQIEEYFDSFLENRTQTNSGFHFYLKHHKKAVLHRIEHFYLMIQKYCCEKRIKLESVRENDKIPFWYQDKQTYVKIKEIDTIIVSNKDSSLRRYGAYLDDCIHSGDPVDVPLIVEKWLLLFRNIWLKKKASSGNYFIYVFLRFFPNMMGSWKSASKITKIAIVLMILWPVCFLTVKYYDTRYNSSYFETDVAHPELTNRHLTMENIPNLSKNQIERLTGEQIESLSDEQVKMFTAEQISWLCESQVACFGAKAGLWRGEKVRALGGHIASANLSKFSVEHIRWLTSAQINQLTMMQIQQCFTSTQDEEMIRKTRIQAILSDDQGATSVPGDGFGEVSPEFLNTLAAEMKHLSKAQIQRLSAKKQIPHLNDFFLTWLTGDQISWLSAEQLNALSQVQIEHGGTNLLEKTTQLRNVGGEFIGRLAKEQIEALNEIMLVQIGTRITALRQKFEYIEPELIPSLTTEQLGELNTQMLISFTDEQIAKLTDWQVWALGERRPVSTKLKAFLSTYLKKEHADFLADIVCMKNWIDGTIYRDAIPAVFYPMEICHISRDDEIRFGKIAVGWKIWFQRDPVPYDSLFVLWLQIKIGLDSISLDGDFGVWTENAFRGYLSEVMGLGQDEIYRAVTELDELGKIKYR